MIRLNIKDFLLERPITINTDDNIYKKEVVRGFIVAAIFSISYGFYEYFILHQMLQAHGNINLIVMFFGIILVVALTTRFSVEKSLMAWLFVAVVEDLCYWIAWWIDTGVYPFPTFDWWDIVLTTFRLLGGLGQAIPFWPYVPFYYIPGFIFISIYHITSYKSAKYGRITAWIVGPFTFAIFAGALTNELLATIILISLPTISYFFVLILLYRNDWKFKEKS